MEELIKVLGEKLTEEEVRQLQLFVEARDTATKFQFQQSLARLAYDKQCEKVFKNVVGVSQKEVIGLTVEQLEKKFPGFTVRVMMEDGEAFFGTCDYRTDRLNVGVQNGLITSCNIG